MDILAIDEAAADAASRYAPLTAPPALYAARFSYAGTGVVAMGDSITANYGNNLAQISDSPMAYAAALSGARTLHRGSTATGGFTLKQIRDTHLPVVVAMTPKPAACIVLGGTNNVGASASFVLADAIAVLAQIYDGLEAAGIRPIACTIPPRGDSATVNALADKYNRSVRKLAASRGYALADYHRVLTDPATSSYRAGLGQTDKIHPSYLGTKVMGQALSSALVSSLPFTTPPLGEHLADATDLLAGAGLFLIRTRCTATSPTA
jgi:lysophospholipase L1-like esterase